MYVVNRPRPTHLGNKSSVRQRSARSSPPRRSAFVAAHLSTRICRRDFVCVSLPARCCWRAIILRVFVYEPVTNAHIGLRSVSCDEDRSLTANTNSGQAYPADHASPRSQCEQCTFCSLGYAYPPGRQSTVVM